ncbi:uncharacterized protein [Nicotiana tomentosiformis]|uniref:uncharacterized protein n=1 Tax=Nicotiana tomentosiformis TaxID=4098 RepID=UPI00388C41DC
MGDSIIVDRVYRSCVMALGGYEMRVDLLLLSIVDFNVILGIDWLSPRHAILDCHAKTVTLAMSRFPRVEWRGSLEYILSRVISYLKAQRMVEKRCLAYLAFVRDVSVNTPTVESVRIVRDFADVFPEDLSGMTPNRDTNFGIDLVSGTQPICISPYRMSHIQLKEQLQKLLDKGFIGTSVPP